MPRNPRVEYEGAVYHVMCRGDRKEAIFRDDMDRKGFLDTLWEVCARTGWRVHAYVLMDNHYHFLLETPEPNLVAGMRWFQGTYTVRFNSRHRLCGHLFQGRYKALPVDAGEGEYFLQVSSYIHLNPMRAGLLGTSSAPLETYPWSSYPDYLRPPGRRSGQVVVDRVMGEMGLPEGRAGRRRYAEHLKGLSESMLTKDGRQNLEKGWMKIRRGWCFGSDNFRDRILERLDGAMKRGRRKSFSGTEARAHDVAAAEGLVSVGLKSLSLVGKDLGALRKLDVRKQVLAWWVRKQTMVGNRWLAERLEMGDEGNVAKVVCFVDRDRSSEVCQLKKRLIKENGTPKSED